MPAARITPVSGGSALEISFLKRKTVNSGLTYTAQFSGDLTAWAGGTTISTTAVNAEWDLIIVRDNAAPGAVGRFARVLVSLAP